MSSRSIFTLFAVTWVVIPVRPLKSKVSDSRAIPSEPESPVIFNVVANAVVPAAVNLPWASTVNVGIWVVEPYDPAVTAVLSRSIVRLLPDATVVIPVSPTKVITSLSRSIAPDPVSPAKSKSWAVTTLSI